MSMIIIINGVKYEVHEDTVLVKSRLYFNSIVLAMNETEFFQEETVDPYIYTVRELIKLKDKLK